MAGSMSGHQGAQRPRLCLAHWATYNNIPYRLSDIVGMVRCRDDVSPMDSSLRTLQRTLLLVAAYCRFEAVDKGWHDLMDVALDGNTKLGMDGLDSVLELLSGMREVEQHDEGIYPEALPNDAGARELVLVMLMARLAGRRMAPPLKGPQLDLTRSPAPRGDLVHTGAAYDACNLSLHLYVDSPRAPHQRDAKATYAVDAKGGARSHWPIAE